MNSSQESSYGVTSQRNTGSVEDQHLEALFTKGFSVITGVLGEDELAQTRTLLDNVYRQQVEEAASVNLKLESIHEENVARMPFAYDPFFTDLLQRPSIMEYVKKVLGGYFVLHLQNGIINLPNEKHHQSSWHRDLPYQDFVISNPLAVNALYCIDEFSEKTGATFVLPFSHKMESIPSAGYIEKNGFQVTAPAGSVILMDSMVFHKAGYNSSAITRRAINHVYVAGIIRQQVNIPVMLKGKYADDPFLKMLLGYETQEAASVLEYRLKRKNKLKG